MVEYQRYFDCTQHFPLWQKPDALLSPSLLTQELAEYVGRSVDISRPIVENRVRTSVSDVEHAYRAHLVKLGYPTGPMEAPAIENREEGIIGKSLHEADILFHAITRGYTGKYIGRLIDGENNKEKLRLFATATEGIARPDLTDEDAIFEALSTAWDRYLSRKKNTASGPIPLFGSVGPNPLVENELYESDTLRDTGRSLARAWAKAIGIGGDSGWEFADTVVSNREYRIFVNLPCGIQLIGQLDCMNFRFDPWYGTRVQSSDLKTGSGMARSLFQSEIQYRQAQLMCFLTQTAAAVEYNHSPVGILNKNKHIYMVDHTILQPSPAASFAYRVFDRYQNQFNIIPLIMNNDEWTECVRWLDWYGRATYYFSKSR